MQERLAIIDRLTALDPALAALHRIDPVELLQVQPHLRALPDGALLLEFAVLPDRLVLFVITTQTFSVQTIALTSEELHEQERVLRAGRDYDTRSQGMEDALNWLGAHGDPILQPFLALLPQSAVGPTTSRIS